jgi:predicted HicB family RNase H-like nuclease
MAIAKNPKRFLQTEKTSSDTNEKAEEFIEGASGKIRSADPEDIQKTSEKIPVLIRIDKEILKKIDAIARSRGISRSAWIQYTLSGAIPL